MKKFLFILLLLVGGASVVQASNLPIKNAGFVPANIWYSKDPFFAGETIRIYTIIFNGSTYDLSGNVEFLDNGSVIGKTNFSLSGNGRVQDVWVNWKTEQGAHTITARIVNVISDGPNGKQSVSLDNTETGKSERVVDADPAIAAAQSKMQVQKVTDAGNQTLGKIDGVINTVNESIPSSVKENFSTGANTLEIFRKGVGYQLQVARENKSKEIDAMKASVASTSASKKSANFFDTVSNATEKPFAYIMFAILALLQYFFQWQILFYGIILYAGYCLIKWVVGRVRDR